MNRRIIVIEYIFSSDCFNINWYMGKELNCLQRIFQPKVKSGSINKIRLLKEFEQNWSFVNVKSIKNIKEDVHVVLIIQRNTSLYSLVCKGFTFSNNSYKELISYLKEKQLIKKHENRLIIYSIKGMVWVREDNLEEKFCSGQRVLVNVRNKRKKAIRKIK